MLRKIYNKTLSAAQGRKAVPMLAIVSFAESSFFPLPPDLLLLPMALARRDRAWWFATVCTIASVAGGWLGYALGYLAFALIGQKIIDAYHLQEGFNHFAEGFKQWGVAIILIKGLTPIPFKLVTIASGVAHLDLLQFTLACALTRGFRFFLLSALAVWFGEPVKVFVEKHLPWVLLGILTAIIIGFCLVVYA